jgi:oxalate decarboxylase/phosphoglucose isomerase-like protein (cupin superfamily)
MTMEHHGTFVLDDFADELAVAADNRELGTRLVFENEAIQVWEVRLEPGERGRFHIHDRTYFWTVVDPGRGLQRSVDGTLVIRDYAVGDTRYLVHSADNALIHDLENVGDTTLRFVTVALKTP